MSKPQRRKGNLQCASSNKAAELLQNNGLLVPLVGLEGLQLSLLSGDDTSSSGVLGVEEFGSVASEIRISLKKLSKRDSLTREKGIREILEIIPTLETSKLKALFNCYAPIYVRLVTDSVTTVRTFSNTAFLSFLKTLRKDAKGLFLKEAIPFLLFSLSDVHSNVARSAENVLTNCFEGEKRKLLFQTFARPTINLALEIINQKHKLVQPQKVLFNETNEQRQSRLISQALVTIELLLEESSELTDFLVDNFTKPATITALMKMSTNIKISLFTLLKRLIQMNSEPFVLPHISAIIMANLDNADVILCRNAINCFLGLALNSQFRKTCKFEKAVVPKFLFMIRKKNVHWNVLATLLFPLFVVVCKELPSNSLEKWIRSALDSFFEGDMPSYLISSWSTAFAEVVGYCFEQFSIIPNLDIFLFEKVLEFVNVVVSNTQDDVLLLRTVDFVVCTCQRESSSFQLNKFKQNLYCNIFNKLPNSFNFISFLLKQWNEKNFAVELIKFPNIPNKLFVSALQKDLTFVNEKINDLDQLIFKQIALQNNNVDKIKLLDILCTLVVESKADRKYLNELFKSNKICYCFSSISLQLVKQIFEADPNLLLIIILNIVNGILTGELPMDKKEAERIVEWILQQQSLNENQSEICLLVLNRVLTSELSQFSLILLDNFFSFKKIPKDLERNISQQLFENILSKSQLDYYDLAVNLLSLLDADKSHLICLVNDFLDSDTMDLAGVKRIASVMSTLKFSSFSVYDFIPNRKDFEKLAIKLERKFLLDMLMEENTFLFSFLPARKNLLEASNFSTKSFDLVEFLLNIAKKALFTQELVSTLPLLHTVTNDKKIVEIGSAAHGFIWLTLAFVDFYCSNEFSLENRKIFQEFLTNLSQFEIKEEILLNSVKLLLPIEESKNYVKDEVFFPLSVIFALRRTLKCDSTPFASLSLTDSVRQLKDSNFEKLTNFLKSTFLIYYPSLAFAFALNFNASDDQIPILLEANSVFGEKTELEMLATTVKSDTGIDDSIRLRRWTYEFERTFAVFTPENRHEHFVTLSVFVERKEFEEWLFTLQSDDEAKNALSCAVLRFCLKVMPYFVEVEDALRDFINCGFITALQSCTDYLVKAEKKQFLNDVNEKTKRTNVSLLLFVLGQICAKFCAVYENCLRINGKKAEYYNIQQEWNEFFSPSAVNFIVSWLLNLAWGVDYPNSFILQICRTIQFLDLTKISIAELICESSLENENVVVKEIIQTFFVGYPSNKQNILAAATRLLFEKRPKIQLAASRILQSNFLFMFEHESRNISFVADCGALSLMENTASFCESFDVDEEDVYESLVNSSAKQLPKLLTSALQSDNLQENEDIPTELDQRLLRQLRAKASSQNGNSIDLLLLVWDAFVRFSASMNVSTRVAFCDPINVKLVDKALTVLFAKLPNLPFKSLKSISSLETDSLININKLFTEDVDYYKLPEFNIDKFVCNLYYRSLVTVPALVRQWYISLPKNFALIVNKYTRKHVSPLVLTYEIGRVGSSTRRGRLEVKVMASVNEVAAAYKLDDSTINLHIQLPEDFPLVLASIETQRKIVRQDLHRKWLLQLETFLSHQNGSLLDGILQWKRNIDKHLEGIDDCTICMLTVSTTNYQLPRIRCRQCKNKFHGNCLYKWFKTSSNTSCPLCRANFVR